MSKITEPNLANPVHLFAFGFGSGLSPIAPGTSGTIAAIIPWFWLGQQNLTLYISVLTISVAFGIYICGRASRDLGVHDHGGIVWDEFCGLWLTMVVVPFAWQWLVIGFFLFRFFDIVKPWPIGWLDKKVSGGFGIMVDDLLAAVYSWIILQGILYFYETGQLYSYLHSYLQYAI